MDSATKSFNPNKHLKEQFVSNLSGSSMLELFILSTILPGLIVLRDSIGSKGVIDTNGSSSKKDDNAIVASKNSRVYMCTMVVDFLFIVLPMILFTTVLAEWTYINAIVLMLLLLLSYACKRYKSSLYSGEAVHSLRTHISSYRAFIMLLTCTCILAVDFKIFPRRYAKAETYGTSVMDLGVGSFVVANAMVSRQARGIMKVNLKNALGSTSPLLFLGFARLVFTAGVDYQVHVGEYGVHWNFFFTLAAVSILTSVVNVPLSYCGILGSLILAGYQVSLTHGLNAYLLSDQRGTDIISQNKEGIFSIFGYWGMYLVGVQLGSYIFFGNCPKVTNKSARDRVWILWVLLWSLTLFLDSHVERVSRRMCNLAYVTWVLASNLQVLAVVMLSDYIPGDKMSLLQEAFNKNLLTLFLLANVLTGLVNMSMDTLFVSSVSALCVLFLYALILCGAAGFADFYGIKLKFW